MDEEQRRYIRAWTRLVTFVKFVDTGKVLRALTRDISGAGVCFVMEKLLDPGTQLELEIKLPDREAPIAFTAEVVWSKAIAEPRKSYEGPTSETGVRFVTIDPKDHALILQFAALNAMPPEAG